MRVMVLAAIRSRQFGKTVSHCPHSFLIERGSWGCCTAGKREKSRGSFRWSRKRMYHSCDMFPFRYRERLSVSTLIIFASDKRQSNDRSNASPGELALRRHVRSQASFRKQRKLSGADLERKVAQSEMRAGSCQFLVPDLQKLSRYSVALS